MPRNIACHYPFTSINVGPGGDTWFCCPEWTRGAQFTLLGNIRNASIRELWNGEVARSIREAMYSDTQGKFCLEPGCPILNGGIKVDIEKIEDYSRGELFWPSTLSSIQNAEPVLEAFPSFIIVSNDWRCNLRCKMCSTTTYYDQYGNNDPSVAEVTNRLFDEIEENIDWVKRIFLAGYGDPFAIKRHVQFLRKATKKTRPEVELLTNGILLTPAMWESIQHNKFYTVRVSVDAAQEKTYDKIRKRGDWNVLLRNLKYLGELRRAGILPGFEINMTVMHDNYQEVYEFFDFGMALGCDCVGYQIIHGELGGQNFLSPRVDWQVVSFLQEFLVSDTVSDPHCYVDFLKHLSAMKAETA